MGLSNVAALRIRDYHMSYYFHHVSIPFYSFTMYSRPFASANSNLASEASYRAALTCNHPCKCEVMKEVGGVQFPFHRGSQDDEVSRT